MALLKTLSILALLGFGLGACAVPKIGEEPAPSVPEEAKLDLVEVSYSYLPGWVEDSHAGALKSFVISCGALMKRPLDARLGEQNGSGGVAGLVRDWRAPCEAAVRLTGVDDATARRFFEQHFVPWLATDRGRPDGLFTGYYEAELQGSWVRTPVYHYPIYGRPADLIDVDLGAFREDLKGTRLAGRLKNTRLVPYDSRKDIDNGALAGKGLELLWVNDPVDAFFLHIQGSGRVRMSDGSVVRVGFAGRNGHAYTAIGKVLIEQGHVAREDMSMQAIRRWIGDNPKQADKLMAANASYIFFTVQKGAAGGPQGAMGVALTAERSLAVDRRFVPLGVPVWLATTDPRRPGTPLRRLLVAQDTGGAIVGPVRGDFFWGFGELAAAAAGVMKERGRAYLLLPNGVRPQS